MESMTHVAPPNSIFEFRAVELFLNNVPLPGGLAGRVGYRTLRTDLRQIRDFLVAQGERVDQLREAIGGLEKLLVKQEATWTDSSSLKSVIYHPSGEWSKAKDALRGARLCSSNPSIQLTALSAYILMINAERLVNGEKYDVFFNTVRLLFHQVTKKQEYQSSSEIPVDIPKEIRKETIIPERIFSDTKDKNPVKQFAKGLANAAVSWIPDSPATKVRNQLREAVKGLLQRVILIHMFSTGKGAQGASQTVEQLVRGLFDGVIEKYDTFESFLAWVYDWEAVVGDAQGKNNLGAHFIELFRKQTNREANAQKQLLVHLDDIALLPTKQDEMQPLPTMDNWGIDRQQIFITGRLKVAQETGTFAIFGVVAERVPYLGSVLGIKKIAFYEDSAILPHSEQRITVSPLPSGEAVRLWLRKHPHKREMADKSFGILQYTLVDNKIEDLPEANLEDRFVNTFTAGNEVFGVKELSAKKKKGSEKYAEFHLIDTKTEASSKAGKNQASTYVGKIEKVGGRSSYGWKTSSGKTMVGALSGSRKSVRATIVGVTRNIRVAESQEKEVGAFVGLVNDTSGIIVVNKAGTLYRLGSKSIDEIAADVVSHVDNTYITYEAKELGKLESRKATEPGNAENTENGVTAMGAPKEIKEVKAVANELEAFVLVKSDGDDAFTHLEVTAVDKCFSSSFSTILLLRTDLQKIKHLDSIGASDEAQIALSAIVNSLASQFSSTNADVWHTVSMEFADVACEYSNPALRLEAATGAIACFFGSFCSDNRSEEQRFNILRDAISLILKQVFSKKEEMQWIQSLMPSSHILQRLSMGFARGERHSIDRVAKRLFRFITDVYTTAARNLNRDPDALRKYYTRLFKDIEFKSLPVNKFLAHIYDWQSTYETPEMLKSDIVEKSHPKSTRVTTSGRKGHAVMAVFDHQDTVRRSSVETVIMVGRTVTTGGEATLKSFICSVDKLDMANLIGLQALQFWDDPDTTTAMKAALALLNNVNDDVEMENEQVFHALSKLSKNEDGRGGYSMDRAAISDIRQKASFYPLKNLRRRAELFADVDNDPLAGHIVSGTVDSVAAVDSGLHVLRNVKGTTTGCNGALLPRWDAESSGEWVRDTKEHGGNPMPIMSKKSALSREQPDERNGKGIRMGMDRFVNDKIDNVPEASLEDTWRPAWRFVNTFTTGNEVFAVKELSAKKAKEKDAAFHLVDTKTEASSEAGQTQASTYMGKIEKVGVRTSYAWKTSSGTMLGALSGSRKGIRMAVANGAGDDGMDMEVDGQMEGKMVKRNIRMEKEMGTFLGLVNYASGIVVISEEGIIYRLGPKSIDEIAGDVVNRADDTDIIYKAKELGKLREATEPEPGNAENAENGVSDMEAVVNELEAFVLVKSDGNDAFTRLEFSRNCCTPRLND